MDPNRKPAVIAVTLVVAALSIFAAINSYQISALYAGQSPDAYGTARAEDRFTTAKEHILLEARLAYISDLDPAQPAFAAAYQAAQYALAPRALTTDAKAELAIGNFSKPVDYAAAGAARGFTVETDFGNGVVLYRRKR